MQVLTRPWGAMHYRTDGCGEGPTLVFANSLGTDLRIWDGLLPFIPGYRIVRYDMRGHGLSDCGGQADIADLADDAVALIEATSGAPVIFVGLSIGGLIAQVVAAKRPDLLRAVVLSNTAAKLGTVESWQARIDAVTGRGLAAIADAVMERWFSAPFRARAELALWRNMLVRTSPAGYVAACAALAAADQTASTAGLRLPTLAVAGSEDGATPPEVVEATARLVPAARFHVIPGVGHLPSVEAPEAYAAVLAGFLEAHAHV